MMVTIAGPSIGKSATGSGNMSIAIDRCHHLEYLCMTKKPSNNQTNAPNPASRAMGLLKKGITNPGAVKNANAINMRGQRLKQAVPMTSFVTMNGWYLINHVWKRRQA